MNQELQIVEALKAYAWLRPYQRKEVARSILSVSRTAERAGVPGDEVAAMFSTALKVLSEPDNEKAA
jgi:hypothetical protein